MKLSDAKKLILDDDFYNAVREGKRIKEAKEVMRALNKSVGRNMDRLKEFRDETGFESPALTRYEAGGKFKQSASGKVRKITVHHRDGSVTTSLTTDLAEEIIRARTFVPHGQQGADWLTVSGTKKKLREAGYEENLKHSLEIVNAFLWVQVVAPAEFVQAYMYDSEETVRLVKSYEGKTDSDELRQKIKEQLEAIYTQAKNKRTKVFPKSPFTI